MDPITNPYAPGAGQRPPELAGRDEYLRQFDVVLERIRRGRPDRSVLLTGLRGVGKTVLLNAMRGQAVRANWGTGKLEARPDQSLRRPLASALHTAVRELGHPQQEDVAHVLGVVKAFAQRDAPANAKLRDRWSPGIDVPAVSGRADSGDIEIDLVELLTDVGGLAADVGKGVGIFIDEMQDLGPDDVSAVCAAFHEIGQQALPVLVVGAGLPHLPAVLSASKSYSERLFRYHRIDRLERSEAYRALQAPAADEGAEWQDDALAAMYAATGGYPYFIQAYGKEVWDLAPQSPITAEDVRVAAPSAEAELAVGFFGSRYERATPGEREYLRAMAEAAITVAEQEVAAAGADAEGGDAGGGDAGNALGAGQGADAGEAASEPVLSAESRDPLTRAEEVEAVPTSVVAEVLGRKPQSLSPARDALMKKGLVYAPERGKIAFTVPHFGRYLRNSA